MYYKRYLISRGWHVLKVASTRDVGGEMKALSPLIISA